MSERRAPSERIVVDTNALISRLLLPRSVPGDAVRKAADTGQLLKGKIQFIGREQVTVAGQAVPLGHVIDVSSRANDGVHEARFSVHTNVCLHAEVPLIAFLGLVHLRVTLTRAVLGKAGCGNQGGIHHRAGLKHQAFLGQQNCNLKV